ncbi:MAG: hypothetical protein IKG17_06555 [Mogibacterium sp.]|nr:hypothetical protein [Mogibacterium sp.]
MEEQLKEIFTSYYFWLAVEVVVAAVLIFFTVKFSRLKKARVAEINSKQELSKFNMLDEQITNKRGNNR